MHLHSSYTALQRAGRVTAALLAGAATLAGCSSSSTTAPAPAANIAVTSGNTQTGTAGSGLSTPLIATVTDASGNAVSGVSVTFVATGGATIPACTCTQTAVTTGSNGQAQVTINLGSVVGTDSVTATATGVTTPATFTASVTAAAAATVAVGSGDNQTAANGTMLALPIMAIVHDQYGNPVSGATVTWTASGGGILGAASSMTDNTGTAQTTWTLPAVAGADTVTAALMGTSSTAVFTATGT